MKNKYTKRIIILLRIIIIIFLVDKEKTVVIYKKLIKESEFIYKYNIRRTISRLC